MANFTTSSETCIQRFRRDFPCPICGGCDGDQRGVGQRCFGFLSADGEWARCTREEHAGQAPYDEASTAWVHRMYGTCKCGTEHNPAKEKPRQATTIYEYRDDKGLLLYRVLRTGHGKGKRIWQERPDGRGGWIKDTNGVQKILYRLPELLQSLDTPVYIAEGEKAVEALREYGLVATCNPGGAGKWLPQYNKWLSGRRVVILPDNDGSDTTPPFAGQQHAQRIAQSLHGIAASVKVVSLPNLPNKGDAYDYFHAGGTVKALLQLVKKSPEWVPDTAEPTEGREHEGFRIHTLAEIRAQPSQPWMTQGIFKQGGLDMIYGESNTGKSFVGVDMSLSHATGEKLWGREMQQGITLYVAAEDIKGIADRSVAWLAYHRHTEQDIAGKFHLMADPVEFTNALDVERFIARVQEQGVHPDLIVFDTYSDCFSGEEISNTDTKKATDSLKSIQSAFHASVVIIHHSNKAGTAYRGHSSLRAKMDTVIEVTMDHDGLIALRCDKQRSAAKFENIPLKLKNQVISEDGLESSCVLVPDDEQAHIDKTKERHREMLKRLADFGEHGASFNEWLKACTQGKKMSRSTFQRELKNLAGDVLGQQRGKETIYTLTEQGRKKKGEEPQDSKSDESDLNRKPQEASTDGLGSLGSHPFRCEPMNPIQKPSPEDDFHQNRRKTAEREKEAKLYGDTPWFDRNNPAIAMEQALAWACVNYPNHIQSWALPGLAAAFEENALQAKGVVLELRKAYQAKNRERLRELLETVKKMASISAKNGQQDMLTRIRSAVA